MSPKKILGAFLLTAGILALVYGGFSYRKESHRVGIGNFSFGIAQKEKVQIPAWAGVVSAAVGGFLLATGRSRRR